jgi:SAM-dependent MidA family methyltransferase
MKLAEYIIRQIGAEGAIPFRDFMETCLYHPQLGYYTSGQHIIGSSGDFYTSPTLTPAFGAVIAKQLEEMWAKMGRNTFTILEYGAGTGALCRSILNYLEKNEAMYRQLRYGIIEKMPANCMGALPDKVELYGSAEALQGMQGCVLSHELVDNFAVHRVVMDDELMEVYVNYQDGFTEELRPARPELVTYLSELGVKLTKGYCTEINLQALDWITEIARILNRGYVITIDYGYKNPSMFKPTHRQGTLVCYYQHSVNDSFYEHIGEQDITAHVNFSALSHWGDKSGLKEAGFIDQAYFLTALGFRQQLLEALSGEQDIIRAARLAAAINHTLLVDMGSKYKVLIQGKGVDLNKLSGLGAKDRLPLQAKDL